MNPKMFLDKDKINNFNSIHKELIDQTQKYNFMGLEMIHDLIHFLDRFDKKRGVDNPELKGAVFTLVNEILDERIAAPSFMMAYNYPHPAPEEPFTKQQLFEYLDNNWFEMDAADRGYLLAFVPYKEGESPLIGQ